MADFTDRRINQTYKRLVQVDNGTLQNGLGTTLSGSMGDLTVSGALAITGYPNVSASISRLEYFSSSLDATYATDQQLSDVSSSLALETAQLLDFSASLDATFATDAQLSSVSSSFSDTITVIKQDAQYDSGRIGALEAKRLVSSSRQITGALDTIYPRKDFISGAFDITSASLASRFDNLDANYATDAQLIAQSSSFSDTISVIKQDAQYDSGRIGALEAKRLVSSSRQITGALDTIYPRTTIAGISGSGNIYSASFALNINSLTAATSSYALKTEITGSFDALSGSLSTRLTTIQNDAQYDSGRIGALEAKRLVSSSRQITGALDTIYPRTTNAAISGSSDSRFAVLNAATSSYAAKSEITGSFSITSSSLANRIDAISSSLDTYQVTGSSTMPQSNAYLIPNIIRGGENTTTAVTSSGVIFKLEYTSSINGTHIVELPDASTPENTYRKLRFISDDSVTANDTFTISGSNGQLIEGSATYIVDRSYEGVMLWSDGSSWFRIQSKA